MNRVPSPPLFNTEPGSNRLFTRVTLEDLFAAAALAGLLAREGSEADSHNIATVAYQHAAAMLKVRNEGGNG